MQTKKQTIFLLFYIQKIDAWMETLGDQIISVQYRILLGTKDLLNKHGSTLGTNFDTLRSKLSLSHGKRKGQIVRATIVKLEVLKQIPNVNCSTDGQQEGGHL